MWRKVARFYWRRVVYFPWPKLVYFILPFTNIQVAREQAGYTQDTLSEMLGMTPNHLSAIERGASGISLEALHRLCRLLGVSADRIIFGTDEPEAEALALARRISDIKPEYRQQVQELLSAILNMS